MDNHDVARMIQPFWNALLDVEKLGIDIYRDGNYNRGLDIACIARDVRDKFTAEQEALVNKLAEEYRNGKNSSVH